MLKELLFEYTYHYEEALKHLHALDICEDKIETSYKTLLFLIKDANLMTEYKNWCITYEEY